MANTFTWFITDLRDAVQSLRLPPAGDEAAARRPASEDLMANRRHVAIVVRDGDRMVCALTRRVAAGPAVAHD